MKGWVQPCASTDPQLDPCWVRFYPTGSSVTSGRKVLGPGNPGHLTGPLSTTASAWGEKFILTGGCVSPKVSSRVPAGRARRLVRLHPDETRGPGKEAADSTCGEETKDAAGS